MLCLELGAGVMHCLIIASFARAKHEQKFESDAESREITCVTLIRLTPHPSLTIV